MALKINRNLQKIIRIVGWVLLIALIIGMVKTYAWERNYYNTKSAETRAKADVVITEIQAMDYPSEEAISAEDLDQYQVEASEPRYLYIDRLEVKARIKKSTVNSNILPVPQNLHDSMWYAGSSKPGQNGVVLISGLTKGCTEKGLFANLDSLEKDNKIVVELGNGEKYTYSVKEINIIDGSEAVAKLPNIQRRIDDKETLSLVTATKNNDLDDAYSSIVMIRATKD